MHQRKVLILMSTYNGEKFIEEQLDSIFAQEDVSVTLLVRDDGSKDKTISILKKYQSHNDIQIIQGKNLRPAQSFRTLVKACDSDYDYYAYADQDDIWDTRKLQAAVNTLKKEDSTIPLLWYCGTVKIVDDREQDASCCPLDRATSFETIVKTFWSTNGCTMVFNKQMMCVLKSCEDGPIDMHDSWTNAMCLACGGKVVCDPSPLVKYRIHENQVLGMGRNRLTDKIRRFFTAQSLRSKTIRTMLTSNRLEEEKRKYLEYLIQYKTNPIVKVKLLLSRKTDEMTQKDYQKFVLQILTNKF